MKNSKLDSNRLSRQPIKFFLSPPFSILYILPLYLNLYPDNLLSYRYKIIRGFSAHFPSNFDIAIQESLSNLGV